MHGMRGSFRPRAASHLASVFFAVVVAGWLGAPWQAAAYAKGKTKKKTKKEAPTVEVVGRDPRAFADAAALLAAPRSVLLDDAMASAVIERVEQAAHGAEAWSVELWSALDELRGIRVSSELATRLRKAASGLAITGWTGRSSTLKASRRAFEKGNEAYEAGRFEAATQAYRAALASVPGLWDAWNNLALAELHLDNNLLALFEFAALAHCAPQYVGAQVNLTVALERLGLSEAAYEVATSTAREHADLPMVLYNKAWFENARGDHAAAESDFARVAEAVPEYGPARWGRTINTMESGGSVDRQAVRALPGAGGDASPPKLLSRTVSVPAAEAVDGDRVVTTIPEKTRLVVSEEAGEWLAVYWPVDGVKHRLWVHRADLSTVLATPKAVASAGLAPFIGTWSEQWADVKNSGNIVISEVGGRPKVTMRGNWRVWDERLHDGQLSFRKKGGGSNWEFVYRLKPANGGLQLEVRRIHDGKVFQGKLTK